MEPDDDDLYDWDHDDRRAAYERAVYDAIADDHDDDYDEPAGVDPATYIDFARIVQHYGDTARPDHDDIDYDDDDDLDGAEFDNNGERVSPLGLISAIADAIIEFGSFDDIPDDYEFIFEAEPDFILPVISVNRFRFPLYNPRKPACKRRRGFFFNQQYPGQPPV